MIELPELLGTGAIRLACYPPELSLAEKVAMMVSRRELNLASGAIERSCPNTSEYRSALPPLARMTHG